MKNIAPYFSFALLLFFFACSSDQEEERSSKDTVSGKTLVVVQSTQEPGQTYHYEEKKSFIEYGFALKDKHRIALETFKPFEKVGALAEIAIDLKDSLKYLHEDEDISDPKDQKIYKPAEDRAYQAILNYQKALQDNHHLHDVSTRLIDLTRNPEPEDSSSKLLPKVGNSTLLSHGNFFFLGGAPFITKLNNENNAVYTDSNGHPQTRFECNITENTNYIFNTLLHFNNGPIKVALGGPLGGYEIKQRDVRGIGRLSHEFVVPVPVFFLTELGLIPAQLTHVEFKLVPENLGCVSDQPMITFSCSKYLNDKDILGVYIAYQSEAPKSCVIKRYEDVPVWTIDLNNDGTPEFACVSDTFEGASSDKLVEEVWFVNINGVWQIIDWGAELDCT